MNLEEFSLGSKLTKFCEDLITWRSCRELVFRVLSMRIYYVLAVFFSSRGWCEISFDSKKNKRKVWRWNIYVPHTRKWLDVFLSRRMFCVLGTFCFVLEWCGQFCLVPKQTNNFKDNFIAKLWRFCLAPKFWQF